MINDLYFILIIAKALRQPERKTALRAAIEEIQTLGRQPRYERGFLQFQRFMEEVRKNWERSSQKPEDYAFDVVRWLALQVAGGLLELDQAKVALDQVGLQPHWQEEFERLCKEISEAEARSIPRIIIERNGENIGSIPWKHLPFIHEIGNLKPGTYRVKLDTGRVIWQGELAERELIWALAFEEQALDLAADTREAPARTTREITLLNGDLIIRVFPEIESGRLELRIGGSDLG